MKTTRMVNKANTSAFDDRNEAAVRIHANVNQPKIKKPRNQKVRKQREFENNIIYLMPSSIPSL